VNDPTISVRRVAVYCAVFVALVIGGWTYFNHLNRLTWSMIHVSGDWQSGDAHLLELPSGHVVLIDTGFEKYARTDLLPYLDERGIERIDELIITHAHRNHYGSIPSLIDHLESIGRVTFNLPARERCDAETWRTGCDYAHVELARKVIRDAGIELRSMDGGDVLYTDPERGITLEVVYVHDGVSGPVGGTSINGTSAVLRLDYGTTSVLFTGDIGREVGEHLRSGAFPIEADIVTAPHHGVESAASNDFLARVNPDVMMVSNSARQWFTERGDRYREFAAQRRLPVFVTGVHGDVTVAIRGSRYSISSQRDRPAR